jgi:hypothetical protein
LADFLPGSIEFLRRSSPITHVEHLNCPLFLFHAQDDSNVRVEGAIRMAEELRRLGKDVTLVTVPTGGHYHSMIDEGIPRGIEWLSSQAQAAAAPTEAFDETTGRDDPLSELLGELRRARPTEPSDP